VTNKAPDEEARTASQTASQPVDAGRWSIEGGRLLLAARWVAAALVVVILILAARLVPIRQTLYSLEDWFADLGVAGPILFAAVYAIAAVLFLPGTVFNVAAGVFFGPVWGTVSVSLGSTVGAAISFLIARYVIHDPVRRHVLKYPYFERVYNAIGQGDWKLVAILRLTPGAPYAVQNYLYGVTPIRFWPCTIATFVASLPGIFVYVYIGYVSRLGVEAAEGINPIAHLSWEIGIACTLIVLGVVAYFFLRRKARRNLDVADRRLDAKRGSSAAEGEAP
jgi:uncharacterized membrane protein YdjX (TVP38/TMEM64 family)